MIKKKSLLFFLFIALFSGSVFAAVPVVEFSWTPTSPSIFSSVTFDPSITGTPLTFLKWGLIDTNRNYDLYNWDTNVIFSDRLTEGDYDGWDVNTGTWSAAAGYLTTTTDPAMLSHDVNTIADTNKNIHYRFYLNGVLDVARFIWNSKTKIYTNGGGYGISFINNGGVGNEILLRKEGGATLFQISNGLTTGAWHDVNIYHDANGWIQIKLDGNIVGTANDTTYMDGNVIKFSHENETNGVRFDDLNFTEQKPAVLNADKNESITYTSTGIKNICLTATNADGSTTTCHNVTVGSFTENPVIKTFDYNLLYGLNVTDFNAHFILECDSNATTINYKTTLNGSSISDYNTASGDKNYIAFTPKNGSNTATFVCTAGSGTASQTASFSLYLATFHLVDENSGIPLSYFEQFNYLRGTDYNTGATFDFNSAAKDVNLSGLSDTTFRIDINYTNGLYVHKEFTLSVLDDETEPKICIANLNNSGFAEQTFTSSQKDGFVLRHKINNCYSIATYTKYSYITGYQAIGCTIAQPYVLYYFDGNIKTVLSDLDGGVALVHSLLSLRLNKTIVLDIQKDTLAVSPLMSGSVYDTNKMQVFYRSFTGDNVALTLKIYSEQGLLWTYTETGSPNLLTVTFDWNSWNLTDENVLRVVAEKTNSKNVVKTLTHYFSISGEKFGSTFNPAVAVIFAVIVVLFGLTLVTARFAFSWFGILIVLIGLGIVSLGPMVWWAKFMSATLLITLAYVMMIYKNETSRVA